MLKKIFKPQSTGIAALILTIASVLSYVMGMVRDIVFANFYGASTATDAYNASFLIPDAIFNLFVAGALTAAFIPVFSSYLTKKEKDDAATVASSFLAAASLVVVVVGTIAYFFMPELIAWYFKDATPEKIDLTIKMSRILLLSPLLFAVSNTLGNILISHKQFVSYALAPFFYNVGIIIGIFFFSEEYGIFAAAWGAVFGIVLHLLSRLFELRSLSFRFTLGFDFMHPGLRKIAWLMIPKTIGLMSWQVSLWMINFIGNNKLADGSVTAFYYARNLQSFPVSIFGIALATAVFPYLSDHAAAGRKKIFAHQYQKSLRQILFLTLPAAAGILLLANPIVELIYGRGAFDPKDVALTSSILALFAISIPLEGAIHLTARAFYAHKNTIIPVAGALMFMTIILAGSATIAPTMGASAFSLFFTIGSAVQITWLLIMLRGKLEQFNFKDFLISLFKMGIAVAAMSATIVLSSALTFLPAKLLLIFQILLGALIFFVVAFFIGCEELEEAKNIVLRQLKKKFVPVNQQADDKK